QPNPLLPMAWQRAHNLPRSSHQRESQFASQLMQRLTTSAPVIVWSCPQFEGERELRVSPFLRTLPEHDIPPALLRAETAFHTLTRQALESLPDNQGPALHPDEPIRRNSQLLAVQAMQPQAAFVQYRLHANAVLPLPQTRQSSERGTLVHRALATLWQGLQTSTALAQLPDAELRQRCEAAAAGALAEHGKQLQQALPARWRELEQQALVQVLHEWLQFEKQRQTPFAVSQIEQNADLELAGLALSLRLDRVDQLSDGTAIVMDYKTGASWQTPPWTAERPHDVQLMLYALATDAPLAGVVAARVRAGDAHFKGLSTSEDNLPKLKPDKLLAEQDLDSLRHDWRTRLQQLAREFVSGVADNRCYHPSAGTVLAAPFLRLMAIDADDQA
ncbi:MAG TPA: PD-(D/E)XK nuclease family protein, partial [Permianibacter sp.]|nr:PD-(D/E)XK nuclease family protein [Permianibacter sp.]